MRKYASLHRVVLVWVLVVMVACNGTNQNLQKISDKRQLLKPILAAGGVAGLFIGKKLIDGPMFTENVSLKGKNIVITGGNTGLGKATAIKMASLGANTILLCKSQQRGDDAVEEIKRVSNNNQVSNVQLDLSSLESIRKGAAMLRNRVDNIDVLINNAGVMAIPQRTVTADNFEAHIGINHLGHFALTGLLLDLLQQKNADNSLTRVVNVASHAHLFGKLDRDNIMLDKPGSYEPWPAYGNSKQANILYTHELARRLQSTENNGNVLPLCCHPGLCRTELGRYMFNMDPMDVPEYFKPFLAVATSPLLYISKSAEQGAQTQEYLAASSEIALKDSGKYFDNSKPISPYKNANDNDLGKWLWSKSEELTGVSYLSD